MKPLLLFCLILIAFSGEIKAQLVPVDSTGKVAPYRSSFYIEFGGNAMVGSFNYERILALPAKNKKLVLRAGGLFFPVPPIMGGYTSVHFLVPVEVSYISGQKAIKPEFGFGLTAYFSDRYIIFTDRYETSNNYLIYKVLRLGVRWQVPGQPYFIRAGFTPIFFGKHTTNSDLPFMPYYWMSFGKSY